MVQFHDSASEHDSLGVDRGELSCRSLRPKKACYEFGSSLLLADFVEKGDACAS